MTHCSRWVGLVVVGEMLGVEVMKDNTYKPLAEGESVPGGCIAICVKKTDIDMTQPIVVEFSDGSWGRLEPEATHATS